ncbi:hypothetical protein IMY05_004G0112200 [Salix suchowensis]|nr:hypothetical protein IMY05_004G0112200 [Salix suchowensis]
MGNEVAFTLLTERKGVCKVCRVLIWNRKSVFFADFNLVVIIIIIKGFEKPESARWTNKKIRIKHQKPIIQLARPSLGDQKGYSPGLPSLGDQKGYSPGSSPESVDSRLGPVALPSASVTDELFLAITTYAANGSDDANSGSVAFVNNQSRTSSRPPTNSNNKYEEPKTKNQQREKDLKKKGIKVTVKVTTDI